MRRAIILLVAAGVLCAPAVAHPLYLSGTVGAAPAFFMLEQDKDDVTGWYLYLRVGKEIRLSGTRKADGSFVLEETAPDNRKTGTFNGKVGQGRWQGTWRKAADAPALAFSLKEENDTLGTLNGRFRCTTRKVDKQFGYTYSYSLDLAASKGEVRKLTIASEATSRYDQHRCAIALRDLAQVSSDVGILLRAEGDTDAQQANAQRCSIRIVGAGGYLYVRIGDTTESGNDCKGAGDSMFCSPRGSWTDLIVDRATQACKAVE